MRYEFRGKTPKEAIKRGLKKLSLREDEVEITILDEGTTGLFSLPGKHPAVVMIKPKNLVVSPKDYIQVQKQIKKELSTILKLAQIPFDSIKTTVITGRIFINIIAKEKEAQNLKEEFFYSLENILYEIINKNSVSNRIKLYLDYNFIRRKLEEKLTEESKKIALEVANTGQPYKFNRPLKFFLRKIIHDAVRDIPGVTSCSYGTGDEKIVEILQKKIS